MATVYRSPIYDRLLDYIVAKATPQDILAFKATDEEQERIDKLLDRNNAGILTPQERAELDEMVAYDELVSILKARALVALKRK